MLCLRLFLIRNGCFLLVSEQFNSEPTNFHMTAYQVVEKPSYPQSGLNRIRYYSYRNRYVSAGFVSVSAGVIFKHGQE